jgi:tyrosyl-tRNA synthetase
LKGFFLDLEKRIELVIQNTEEIVTFEEIRNLLETKRKPKAYWGFECSGFLHIGIGLIPGKKIKDMVKAGFEFTVFLADWHSWINNKLGGKMENIRICGEYFKHCFESLGLGSNNIHFVWASELAENKKYWEKTIRIAKAASLRRVQRALTIMGREMDSSNIETSWIFYPCMQAADIFQMNIDAACGGIDQRKAHMLARDVAQSNSWKKPVCVHTPLLLGLQTPPVIKKSDTKIDDDTKISQLINSKMSKSKPENCIFVHDTPNAINSKIRSAFCPPKQEIGNPILEHAKLIVIPELGRIEVPRLSKHGGPITFENYKELKEAYREGKVHPLDLKNGVANALIEILKPVREHFLRNPDPLEKIKRIETTR